MHVVSVRFYVYSLINKHLHINSVKLVLNNEKYLTLMSTVSGKNNAVQVSSEDNAVQVSGEDNAV